MSITTRSYDFSHRTTDPLSPDGLTWDPETRRARIDDHPPSEGAKTPRTVIGQVIIAPADYARSMRQTPSTTYRETAMATSHEHPSAIAFISELETRAAKGTFVFRGENRDYGPCITSSLYREYNKPKNQPILNWLDIPFIQETEISVARRHSPTDAADPHLPDTLQHLRGNTNLIDFTEDFLIALFFACDGKLG